MDMDSRLRGNDEQRRRRHEAVARCRRVEALHLERKEKIKMDSVNSQTKCNTLYWGCCNGTTF